jgi:hypothetical protein
VALPFFSAAGAGVRSSRTVHVLLAAAENDASALETVLYVAQVVLIATGLASVVLVPVRMFTRVPRIEMRSVPWQGSGPTPWTFAQVEARNRPLARWLAWAFSRDTAFDCTAEFEFRRNGDLVLGLIQGRWSDRPEPYNHQADVATGRTFAVYAPDIAVESKRWTLPPTRRYFGVAVAVLRQDGTAHAWGAESYAFPEWRNPEWEIMRGEYEVTVRISWADRSEERRFRLRYTSGDFAAFRLL